MLSTFTVTTNYGDTTQGSLAWAIAQVDSDPNPSVDTIDFAIPGTGPFTISPTLPFPSITHSVVIDGYSQPGASANTQATGDDAVLMIDLDGTYGYYPTYGLDIDTADCTVQGLAITDFSSGIQCESGFIGNLIQGNFIGTDVTGSFAEGNSDGILFTGGTDDTIGGTTPAARNIISGNTSEDVLLEYASTSGNVVEGNFIGLTASGTSTLSSTAADGVNISNSYGNIIGGTAAGAGNVIGGQIGDGIQVSGSSYNLVEGNFVGTDPTGTIALGNSGPGILIQNSSLSNTIGGTAAGAGNTIAFNTGAGVVVGNYSGDPSTGNAILSNAIYGNGALGIDLGDDYITQNTPGGPHSGPNDLQNFPVLTNAATFDGSTYIVGTLNSTPDATFTIQFFSNSPPDPTGYGQGQDLIGTTTLTTDANGNASVSASFPTVIPAGEAISATATDYANNTSEFGQDVTAFAASNLVVAANDTYGLFVNSSITVPAPGVLGNDYDLTGNPFTAVLVQGTAHGTLSFQADGAFTYTPKANFVGVDTFTYYDTDGTNQSNVATVTIDVNAFSLVVTNTNDSGPGSLRQALLVADLSTGASPATIRFEIPGTGPFTIQPLTPLPTITHPTVIDGYNQAGAKPNTLAQGDNAVILIELLGSGGGDGVAISAGGSTVEGLAISRFEYGIHLTSAGGDVIIGNFIGTGTSGTGNAGGNSTGILVDGAGGNRIGGTAPADRNLISSNDEEGVWIDDGSTGDKVQGNWIGVDVTGETHLGNQYGVVLSDAPGNTIGGPAAGAGNVISTNIEAGIELNSQTFGGAGSPNTLIQGNLIGTDATGEVFPGDYQNAGVLLYEGSNCTIGGSSAKARNVISDNIDGIEIGLGGSVVSGTVIQGNFIGTDANGTQPLGNLYYGIDQNAGSGGTLIGGPSHGEGNVISDSRFYGISDQSSPGLAGTVIQGNFIGTDANGTQPLGNGSDGIFVGDNNDTIGGTTASAGNVISANAGAGIALSVVGALVQGNFIGTDVTGTKPLGNAGDGITASGSNNTIGGTTARAGNLIAFNGGSGVGVVNNATGVGILANSISGNTGLGIDLGDDGVTPNTPGGPHGGPNDLQNFPVLLAAITFNGRTYVKGTFNSGANNLFTLQFFANAKADPSGFGQGQTYLGQATVSTDSNGNASFQVSFPTVAPGGQFASATATDPGNDTSEFAADVPIVASAQPVYAVGDQYHVDSNTSLVVIAPGVQANDIATKGGSFSSVEVTGPAHGSLTLNADGSFSYTPNKNFTGTDSFTYEDIQGATTSNVATVTIAVNPKTFTVTNTGDSGTGSLRQAILNANQATSAAPDTILFKIPGTGPFTISPMSPLPALIHATIINGYSQPGAAPNTLASGDNAVIEIQLSGVNVPSAPGLVIAGGGSTVKGLDLTGFDGAILLNGNGQDLIVGNVIGLSLGGVQPNPGTGVIIDGVVANTIGGTAPASRNVISGNEGFGIAATNAPGQVIQGNYIGTDTTGTVASGNGVGVQLVNSSSSQIGGGPAGARNIISANYDDGIQLLDSLDVQIQGNLIGTDVTGTQPLGNGSTGVEIDPNYQSLSANDSILKNVISANGGGILIFASNNVIQGNLIGTDITGTRLIGNSGPGIDVSGSSSNTIGGTAAGAGNVISDNNVGIAAYSDQFGQNLIQGNKIGTDITGTVAMGNATFGISDVDQFGNTIGGTTKAAANVISANGQDGIQFSDLFSTSNLVEGNFIGTDPTGTGNLGNGGHGIDVQDANNTIGGTARGAGNTIAFNHLAGVAVVDDATGVAILSNAIFSNLGLGIDLNDDGVTPNHAGGPIFGPNDYQNFPVLTSAVGTGSKTIIAGSLNGAAGTIYLIPFFADTAADPSGYGQGQTLIGSITVTTDSNGNASFTATLSATVPAGQFISATATEPNGNTSEFAQDVTVTSSTTASAAAQVGSPRLIAPTAVASAPAKRTTTSAAARVSDAVVEDLARELVRLRQRRQTALGGSENRSHPR